MRPIQYGMSFLSNHRSLFEAGFLEWPHALADATSLVLSSGPNQCDITSRKLKLEVKYSYFTSRK